MFPLFREGLGSLDWDGLSVDRDDAARLASTIVHRSGISSSRVIEDLHGMLIQLTIDRFIKTCQYHVSSFTFQYGGNVSIRISASQRNETSREHFQSTYKAVRQKNVTKTFTKFHYSSEYAVPSNLAEAFAHRTSVSRERASSFLPENAIHSLLRRNDNSEIVLLPRRRRED